MQYASRLRFPKLLALAAVMFVVDLIFPDVIPFADEILLGLITLLLAMFKKQDRGTTLSKNPVSTARPNSKLANHFGVNEN